VSTKECKVPAAVVVTKEHAGCDAGNDDSEEENAFNKDQTNLSQHVKPKRWRRKSRKNKSRGGRSRAKAAAALALLKNSQIERVSVNPDHHSLSIGPASGTGDFSIPVAEGAALTCLTKGTPVSMIGATHASAKDVSFAAAAGDRNHAMSSAWKLPPGQKPQ
jgi:hypothetical protein